MRTEATLPPLRTNELREATLPLVADVLRAIENGAVLPSLGGWIDWAIALDGMEACLDAEVAKKWPKIERLRNEHFPKATKKELRRMRLAARFLNTLDWIDLAVVRGKSDDALTVVLEVLSTFPIEMTMRGFEVIEGSKKGTEKSAHLRRVGPSEKRRRNARIRAEAAKLTGTKRAKAKRLKTREWDGHWLSEETIRKII